MMGRYWGTGPFDGQSFMVLLLQAMENQPSDYSTPFPCQPLQPVWKVISITMVFSHSLFVAWFGLWLSPSVITAFYSDGWTSLKQFSSDVILKCVMWLVSEPGCLAFSASCLEKLVAFVLSPVDPRHQPLIPGTVVLAWPWTTAAAAPTVITWHDWVSTVH